MCTATPASASGVAEADRRARSRPCARGSSRRAAASTPATARGTGSRPRARRARTRSAPPAPCRRRRRRERPLRPPRDEQDGGQQRGREQRRDRRRRLGVRVGQPVVDRRPPDLRGEPGEQQQVGDERRVRRPASSASARHVSASRPPPATPAASRTIPSSAKPRPSEVRMRYFQPASSARGLPLKPTRIADAAVVASTSSHAAPRLPASGTASSTAQKANSAAVVGTLARSGRNSDVRRAREVRGRDERAREPDDADHADEQPARRRRPRATARPRSPGSASATPPARARRRPAAAARERGTACTSAPRHERERPQRASAGAPTARTASDSRLVTQAPQRGGVAGAELGEDPLVEDGRDERDERQVERDAELDRER